MEKLTDLGPVDPDIFAFHPPKKRKRKATPPTTLIPPNGTNSNILYHRVPTPIQTFIPPLPLPPCSTCTYTDQ